jgi:hypothetical protein
MNQPTSDYRAMVTDAARQLESAFRRGNTTAKVWAVPSLPDKGKRGALVVTTGAPRPDARLVSPRSNGASGHGSWLSVPYSAMESILYQAARCEPIL